jgi:uncharacterized protein YkwD
MKIFRSILVILLFFVVIYALKTYLRPFNGVSDGNLVSTSSSSVLENTQNGGEINGTSTSNIAIDILNKIKNVDSEIIAYSANRDRLPPVLGESNAGTVNNRLTDDGVFFNTNIERKKQSLPDLKRSSVLDRSAQAKLNDMFSNQYFEHVSPGGTSVSDVVNAVGYKFLVVGENLALGNFEGDSKVMAAWMASEGHRANILDKRYTEIGIAVGYGVYKGKNQWLAVQHFARPMSSCPSPSAILKDRISKDKEELVLSEGDITSMKKNVDKTDSADTNFQFIVNSYNSVVINYNNKLKSLKTEIANYNSQVNNFNSCLDAITTAAI